MRAAPKAFVPIPVSPRGGPYVPSPPHPITSDQGARNGPIVGERRLQSDQRSWDAGDGLLRRRVRLSTVLITLAAGLLVTVMVIAVSIMLWRGYLSVGPNGLRVDWTPARGVGSQKIYRAVDMALRFGTSTIWSKPWEVTGDVVIEGEVPMANLNILSRNGNITIKGNFKDSRITVQNGTLTVDNASNSYLTARHLVMLGVVNGSAEKATTIRSMGSGFGNRVSRVPANEVIKMPQRFTGHF